MEVLTTVELNNLNKYQHKSMKTTLETWFCKGISALLEERCYPDSWTPNCITLIGQVPQLVMILVTFSQIGSKMTSDSKVDDSLFLWMALSLQWFSQNDIMDGLRARRQKSGSPLGRIIDEALDMT